MKNSVITSIISFVLLVALQTYGQQDVQNANAPKLLPMEKVENSKTPKKSAVETPSVTKTNAPTLNHAGSIVQEKPKDVNNPASKNNAPVLSNQNQIVEPKKDKE